MVENNEILDRYYKKYIDGVNVDNIEFKVFNYDELREFLMKYYFDKELNQFVFWEDDGYLCPYGMHYLEFSLPYHEYSYVVGIVNNLNGGKTITFCMEYTDNYQYLWDAEKKIRYILFVETNYFFRRKGVFTKALSYIKQVFNDCDVVVISTESDMGMEVSLFNKFVNLFSDTLVDVESEKRVYSLEKRKVV